MAACNSWSWQSTLPIFQPVNPTRPVVHGHIFSLERSFDVYTVYINNLYTIILCPVRTNVFIGLDCNFSNAMIIIKLTQRTFLHHILSLNNFVKSYIFAQNESERNSFGTYLITVKPRDFEHITMFAFLKYSTFADVAIGLGFCNNRTLFQHISSATIAHYCIPTQIITHFMYLYYFFRTS